MCVCVVVASPIFQTIRIVSWETVFLFRGGEGGGNYSCIQKVVGIRWFFGLFDLLMDSS